MRRQRGLILTMFTSIGVLVLAGMLLLISAARGETGLVYSFSYAPKAAIQLMLGPQSVCPPFVQCPQVSIKPKAISLWLIESHDNTGPTPIWQTYAKVSTRQVFFVRVQ